MGNSIAEDIIQVPHEEAKGEDSGTGAEDSGNGQFGFLRYAF